MVEQLKNLLYKDDVFVSTCTAAAIRMFGLECFDWDPLVLRDSVEDYLKTKTIPQKLFDKMNCGITLSSTNGYPTTLEIFVPCNAVMSNQRISEGTMGLDDPYTLSWGVWEYLRLTGDSADTTVFSDDVALYAGQVLYNAGITEPPQWLNWVLFDETKMAQLAENMEDPTFYTSRQLGLKENLRIMCEDRDKALVNELKELDIVLPADQ